MTTEISKKDFDYSVLSTNEVKLIKHCESEIDDIINLSSWKIGHVFLKAKEVIDHGRFTEWHSSRYPWGERTVRNMMNIARHFKSAPDADLICVGAQNLLAAPSVPEEARAIVEARAEQNIVTSKADAEEIIRLTKANQALEAKVEALESMPPNVVERVVEKVVEKEPDDLLKREKAIEEKDRQATKILKTVASLEREKKETSEAYKRACKENWDLKKENEKLKSQEEVSSPSTIDAASAKKFHRMWKEIRDWTLPSLMNDVKLAGGKMEETRGMIVSIIKLWSDALAQLDDHYVIDVNSTDVIEERAATFANDVDLVSSLFEKPYSTRNLILSQEFLISPKELHDIAGMVKNGDAEQARERFIKLREGYAHRQVSTDDAIDVSTEQDVVPVEIPPAPEMEQPEFGTDEYKTWFYRLIVDMKDNRGMTQKQIVAELEAKDIKGVSGGFVSEKSIGGRIRDGRKYLDQLETA